MGEPIDKSTNATDFLFELLINGEKQLFFIGFLFLVLLFKIFPGSQFVEFKNLLITLFKLIRFQNFSLFDIINTIGRFQIPICNFLVFLSFCGLVVFGIWYLLLTRFNINQNIHTLLGARSLRMGIFCINFYLIYNLLIIIFSSGHFPKFTGFWDSAFVVTFCGYITTIVVYINSNKDELWEKLKEKFETEKYLRNQKS